MRHIEYIFVELQKATGADFLAIARMEHDTTGKIKWVYSHHSLNEKYKAMEIAYGRGVAGKVMQVGDVWYCTSRKELPAKLSEYPILLAEHIKSFVAIPVEMDRFPNGVLLIGYRMERVLPEKEVWQPYLDQINHCIREGGR